MYRINKCSVGYNLIVLLLSIYMFSRMSWGAWISDWIIGGCLLLSAFIGLYLWIKRTTSIRIDTFGILLISVYLIIFLRSNYDLRNSFSSQFWGNYFPLLCILPVLFCLSYSDVWVILFKLICVLFALFYASILTVCSINKNVYYDFFYPILFKKYSSIFVYMAPNPGAGFSCDYGMTAVYVAIGMCVLLADLFSSNQIKYRKIRIGTVLFLFFALCICAKRSTLIGVIIGFIVLYIKLKDSKGKRYRIVLFVFISFLSALLISLYIPSINNVVDRTVELSRVSNITNGRLGMWRIACSSFLENPYFGKGWRWFKYYSPFRNDVHNFFLQILGECGVILSIPFLAFFATNLRKCWKELGLYVVAKKSNDGFIYIFSLLFQVYFLAMIFFSTAFYSSNILMMYLISSAIVRNTSVGGRYSGDKDNNTRMG